MIVHADRRNSLCHSGHAEPPEISPDEFELRMRDVWKMRRIRGADSELALGVKPSATTLAIDFAKCPGCGHRVEVQVEVRIPQRCRICEAREFRLAGVEKQADRA